jgi:TrmH family RNA methyltransferase
VEISSKANAKIKFLKSLLSKKGREESRLFIAEGFNLIKDLTDINEVFVRETHLNKFKDFAVSLRKPFFVLKDFVFDSVCDTETPQGILATVSIKNEKPISSQTVLVLDKIADCGNLGTIVRSAAAFGVFDVVLIDTADIYNPKTVRATQGGIAHINAVKANYNNLKQILTGYKIVALDMNGENIYNYNANSIHNSQFTMHSDVRCEMGDGSQADNVIASRAKQSSSIQIDQKIALVVGSEAAGLSSEIRAMADIKLSIPMPSNKVESLNAAVAASIALSWITR